MVLPKNMIRVSKLKEGDSIEVIAGSAASVKKDDLILRKVP